MPDDLIVHEQIRGGPRFPVGTPVRLDGRFGIDPPDAGPGPPNARIVAVKLDARLAEEWADDGHCLESVTYPNGWEYLVAFDRRLSKPWGWVAERELLLAHYDPPEDADEPTHDEDGEGLAALHVPPLEDLEMSDVGRTACPASDPTRHDLRRGAV